MNLPCDVVMDLVGLYQDGLASPASESGIKEHLRGCSACREYYRLYDVARRHENRQSIAENRGDFGYWDLSRRLKNRHRQKLMLMIGMTSVAAILTSINLLRLWTEEESSNPGK